MNSSEVPEAFTWLQNFDDSETLSEEWLLLPASSTGTISQIEI